MGDGVGEEQSEPFEEKQKKILQALIAIRECQKPANHITAEWLNEETKNEIVGQLTTIHTLITEEPNEGYRERLLSEFEMGFQLLLSGRCCSEKFKANVARVYNGHDQTETYKLDSKRQIIPESRAVVPARPQHPLSILSASGLGGFDIFGERALRAAKAALEPVVPDEKKAADFTCKLLRGMWGESENSRALAAVAIQLILHLRTEGVACAGMKPV